MSTQPLRIGTRGSELALWQANHVAAMLRERGHEAVVEVIRTTGDRMQDPSFVAPSTFPDGSPLDSKGIFIKEIEDALASGRVDVAVHSLKDLPTSLDKRFQLAAIPKRADARDAFVCEEHWGLHMLPENSRVATTSPRRQAMLLALRPDIHFVEMRGNIDTRLRKWSEGQADALVLAAAGLERLGRTQNVHQRFSVDEVCPAPGQGALALEVRNEHHLADGTTQLAEAAIRSAIRALNDETTEFATQAERHVLAAMGGGCMLPLGAFCHAADDSWHLHAMAVSPDGEQVASFVHRASEGTPAAELGFAAAQKLISLGALSLLQGDLATVR